MRIKQTLLALAVTVMSMGTIIIFPSTLIAASCGGVNTSIISCNASKNAKNVKDTGLWQLLIIIINILTAGVGVAAVGGIIYGSVLYTSAGPNAEQVKKARDAITSTIIGIIAYALMYAVLNYLIPGGMFTK